METGAQYAGDFEVTELRMTLSDGNAVLNMDKDFILVEINIFESLFSHSITGSIIVADTREIISKGAFMGQETLTLKIQTPSPDFRKNVYPDDETTKLIDFTDAPLKIHKIPVRSSISSGTQLYELQFISDHAFVNATKRVSKSYVQNKSNIGEMVKDLLLNELKVPSKLLQNPNGVSNIEETLGSRSLLVQNANPLAFITRLTKEAISKKNNSSEYVFYANKNGIHFKTLQSLFDREPRGLFHSGDVGFDVRDTDFDNDSGKIVQNFRRILNFELLQEHDLLLNTHGGMIGGKVVEHNLYRKKLETKTFDYFDDKDYNKRQRVNNERVYNKDAVGASSDEITNTNISVISNSKNKTEQDMWFELKKTPSQRKLTILRRQSKFLELSKGISIKMETHGYTALTVGDMVFVNLQSIGGDDSDPAVNKLFSGEYLVKTLRHKFSYPTKTHTMGMVVVKDGLPFPAEPDTTAFI